MRRSSGTGGRSAPLSAAAALTVLGGFLLSGCGGGGDVTPAGRPSSTATPSRSAPSSRDATPAADHRPESLAALGDSVTTGFDACRPLADCPRSSWVTGTDPGVNSLAQRLVDEPARNTWNFARSGARMADLPGQAEAAAAKRPELVTVLMGANDACRADVTLMTPVAAFRADFSTALRTLRRELPGTQVYVASIPDLRHLWSLGHDDPGIARVWRLGICPSMLGGTETAGAAAEARRRQVHDRVVAYNGALEEVCATDRRCRYDGGAVFRQRFRLGELSPWDWFHPSRKGQARLAETAYARIVTQGRPG
ncbi:GDSL-type esterase/lipase family protein [Streptomyces meridianus]|uniref:GDSL-type esterase/lipase family protein n=1 Tax=Streptomyces meridianus TaxID=2938945 RepID=A0ABT0X6B3_9ACTN|nr:GDSL-type esterase/lipase family protein [Streptomyces meridianus]MCM2578077.1 GDSL-type esterase/lipase family protein [Streptomyces meridianus]